GAGDDDRDRGLSHRRAVRARGHERAVARGDVARAEAELREPSPEVDGGRPARGVDPRVLHQRTWRKRRRSYSLTVALYSAHSRRLLRTIQSHSRSPKVSRASSEASNASVASRRSVGSRTTPAGGSSSSTSA